MTQTNQEISSQGTIRILSDLHLAHPGSSIADVSQISALLEGASTLILNGDTSEERLKRVKADAERQVKELRAMCASAGVELVLLRGNHDPHGPELGSLDLCDGSVFVTHGDILFKHVSPWSHSAHKAIAALEEIEKEYPPDYRDDLEQTLEVSRRVILAMSVFQPKAKHGFKGRLKTLFSQAWPPTRPLKILKVWADGPRLAHGVRNRYRPEAKVIVVGHTHRAFVSRKNGKIAINTGALMPLAKSYAVDIADGEVTVRKIVEQSDQFVLGAEVAELDLA